MLCHSAKAAEAAEAAADGPETRVPTKVAAAVPSSVATHHKRRRPRGSVADVVAEAPQPLRHRQQRCRVEEEIMARPVVVQPTMQLRQQSPPIMPREKEEEEVVAVVQLQPVVEVVSATPAVATAAPSLEQVTINPKGPPPTKKRRREKAPGQREMRRRSAVQEAAEAAVSTLRLPAVASTSGGNLEPTPNAASEFVLDVDPPSAACIVLDATAAECRAVAATTAVGGSVECLDADEGGDSDCAIVAATLGPAAMALPVLPAPDGGGFADDDIAGSVPADADIAGSDAAGHKQLCTEDDMQEHSATGRCDSSPCVAVEEAGNMLPDRQERNQEEKLQECSQAGQKQAQQLQQPPEAPAAQASDDKGSTETNEGSPDRLNPSLTPRKLLEMHKQLLRVKLMMQTQQNELLKAKLQAKQQQPSSAGTKATGSATAARPRQNLVYNRLHDAVQTKLKEQCARLDEALSRCQKPTADGVTVPLPSAGSTGRSAAEPYQAQQEKTLFQATIQKWEAPRKSSFQEAAPPGAAVIACN